MDSSLVDAEPASPLVNRFNSENVSVMKEAFDMFDKDGDGYIDSGELGDVLAQLGKEPSEKALREMIHRVDSDDNGKISFDEFITLMARRKKAEEAQKELIATFQIFDSDGDGEITADELYEFFKKMGENVSKKECVTIIKDTDRNGDGKLDVWELANLLKKI